MNMSVATKVSTWPSKCAEEARQCVWNAASFSAAGIAMETRNQIGTESIRMCTHVVTHQISTRYVCKWCSLRHVRVDKTGLQ